MHIAVLRMVTYINWPNSSNSNINLFDQNCLFCKDWIVFVIKLRCEVEFSQSIHQRRYFMWSRQCKCSKPQTVKNIHYNQRVKANTAMNKKSGSWRKISMNKQTSHGFYWVRDASFITNTTIIPAYHHRNIIFISEPLE